MVGVGSRFPCFTVVAVILAATPAAGFVVSNLDDAGVGSLRQAVLDANANPGPDVVTFQANVTGTIDLTSGEVAILDSVDIQGPGARRLAVDSTARIFDISGPNTVSVTLSGLTLTGGQAAGNGGAIANSGANVTLRAVTISGNSATGEGGAIFHNANGGVLTIDSSTLSGNSAGKAGAIYSIGFNLVIVNSTISGNQATDSVGAIKLEFAFASISNSTISGNTAAFSQGGILAGTGNNQLDLVSTIVSDNGDILGASDLARFAGTVNASYSLVEQNLVAGVINGTDSANLIGVDPMLGPLADHGGPTNTLALVPASPALDLGDNPLGLATDQRGPGFFREISGVADIGAVELGSGVSPFPIPTLSAIGAVGLVLLLVTLGLVMLRRRRSASS